MDTLLILRDTISADVVILRDTIITNVVKVIDSCQPCVQEAETNCNDVAITFFICLAIVAITAIIGNTIKEWNKEALLSKKELERMKMDIEKSNKDIELDRQTKEWQLKKQKKIESVEDDFVDFCQNEKIIKDNLANICTELYKTVMQNRLNINKSNSNDENKQS